MAFHTVANIFFILTEHPFTLSIKLLASINSIMPCSLSKAHSIACAANNRASSPYSTDF
ncbi:hypothetical protein BYT27DRAFT_7201074 [Phlegmacium glaucopus]|nr:hypothetical protein BYT27DRAFT_7201074 [Phlegmacium glaucopus]